MQQLTADARRAPWAAPGQDHHEFVTAQPCNHIRIAHTVPQHAGHGPQHCVAGQVPKGIVDWLEPVQVDIHQRSRLARPLDPGDRLLQMHFEAAAVTQFGQRVHLRQVSRLAFPCTLLRIIAQHPHGAAHLPFVVTQPGPGEIHGHCRRPHPQQQVGMQVHGIAFRIQQYADVELRLRCVFGGQRQHVLHEMPGQRQCAIAGEHSHGSRICIFDASIQGNTEHQVSDGIQGDAAALFAFEQALLAAALGADILDLRHEMQRFAALIAYQRYRQPRPYGVAITAHVALFKVIVRASPRQQILHQGQVGLQIGRMGQPLEIDLQQLLARVAKNAAQRIVDIQPSPFQ
ncbi:hypothetical protein D3C73_847830 [compost metagenome]